MFRVRSSPPSLICYTEAEHPLIPSTPSVMKCNGTFYTNVVLIKMRGEPLSFSVRIMVICKAQTRELTKDLMTSKIANMLLTESVNKSIKNISPSWYCTPIK